MEKRIFSNIGKEISLLGFGGMRFPLLEGTGEIDYAKAEALIARAMQAGINYYDTAWGYHGGESETFFGNAMKKYPRESYYLASKMPTWEALVNAKEDVERIFETQLLKCQTEYFDFYLAHALSKEHREVFEAFDIYDFLMEKKKEGKIKHLGFSFHDNPEVLQGIVDDYAWDFAQIQLNYVDWEASNAKQQYEILAERNIPVLIMEPVRGGALAALNEEATIFLKAQDEAASIASWGMRFAGSLPGVMCVLSGMTTMEQLGDNIKTFSNFKSLSEAEYAAIEQAKTAYLAAGTIPCTGCRYCMPYPVGVDIPRVFALYNNYLSNKEKNIQWFKNSYRALMDAEKAKNCIACGVCVTLCPQNIAIPEHMAEITAFTEKLGV